MKVTIEQGTKFADLTDEQLELVQHIGQMTWELENELLPSLEEVIDYDDPRRQHTDKEGFRYTIEGDTVALEKMLKEVKGLYARLSAAVRW